MSACSKHLDTNTKTNGMLMPETDNSIELKLVRLALLPRDISKNHHPCLKNLLQKLLPIFLHLFVQVQPAKELPIYTL